MSCAERPSSSSLAREIVSLLKDLSEKQQSFWRNVVSPVSELKEVQDRLASQEQSFARETLTKQEVEIRAKNMKEEMWRLQKNLEQRNGQLQASASAAEKYLKEVDDLRLQLSATQAIVDASTALAQSAQLQCLALLKELDEKNNSLKEHEVRVNMQGEQLDLLQKDQVREFPQKQLKDEVLRIEQVIMQTLAKARVSKDCELRKLLDEVSTNNFEKINKLLTMKDEVNLEMK